MECDHCGARRPRSGPCPKCGAPPPGTYSSMRQWRGDAPGSTEGPGGGRGRGSSTNLQRGGWDEGGYDEPPSRSGGRNRRGGRQDYEDVDLGRALVPVHDDLLPMDPSGMGAGVPALPSMPQTDEEERALGIRRPVYIPATGERKRKLGTWRVTSGVLSVMLVCIASCALAGVLGRNTVLGLFTGPVSSTITPVYVSTANVPVTPVATVGPQSALASNVVTSAARGRTCPIPPTSLTSHFVVGQYVCVYVMQIPPFSAPASHTLSIRWFLGNLDIQAPGENSNLVQAKTVAQSLYFELPIPQPGNYHARIYVDRHSNDHSDDPKDPALAATIYFAAFEPTPIPSGTPGTTTPGGTGSPGGTPSPTQHAAVPAPIAWLGPRDVA
jgi:hypothetical protein